MRKVVNNGYIIALTTGNVGVEITEAERGAILNIIRTKPTAPEGFTYRLKADLNWELYELPPVLEDEEEATAEDYEAALAEVGV